jgi:hypothetical protein
MQSKRVVFGNVLPEIPNEKLMLALGSFGKATSPITQLPISTVHPDLRYIKSFRRLVCMVIPHIDKMPQTIDIEHDGNRYTVYV